MSLSKYRHIYSLGRCSYAERIQRNHFQRQALRCFASEVTESKEQPISGQFTQQKKPLTNVPLAKDLFLGRFNPEYLVFPELPDNNEFEELEAMVAPVDKFFSEDLDSKTIDVNAKIPDDVLQQVKDLGLFGLQIPLEHGGLGLNATKFARLSEYTALDGSIAVTLAAHNSIGLKGIIIAGNDAQKEKYLPRLSTGELVAAFALTEPSSGSDAASIQTRATLSEDGKTFHLNGSKIWISNGGIADVFTVFARTEITNEEGGKSDKISAFIVERDFGGVSSGKPEDKLGIRGSNTCEVYFDNTPVPVENVLGEVGGGFKLAMNILNSGRFSMGSSGAGILRKVIGMVAEHAVTRKQFGQPLRDFGIVQEKFAKMTLNAYAMESMAYLTAGLIDQYEKPDLAIEAAMVKVFSSEGCWDCINEALQIMGGMGYMKDYPYERYLRDCRILMIFEGTNEILRLFIGLQGMQHAGKQLLDMVKKFKNPFNNPMFVIKKGFEHARRNVQSNPKLDMKLYDHVHTQLRMSACELEERMIKMELMVQKYLTRYAKNIVDEQLAVKRFADIAIDLYAMIAVLSRASRSMSIGLRNSENEILLAETFCKFAANRIDGNLKQLEIGKVANGDDQMHKIADKVFQHGGYFAEHPLTRNW